MEHKDAIKAFAALAQETRLSVLRLLLSRDEGELSAGDIASELAVTPATLSFHLSQLENAGILASRRVSRQIFYAVNRAGLQDLARFLVMECRSEAPTATKPLEVVSQGLSFPESEDWFARQAGE